MSGAGFPKSERLRKRSEISRIIESGAKTTSESFFAYWVVEAAPETPGPARVAMAAGKRLGSAPRRNRIKRKLREAYRHNKGLLPWMNASLVFVARAAALAQPSREISREVATILQAIATTATR